MLTKENTLFAQEVLKLIDENRATYTQEKRITSDYRLEKETTNSYNGRQILELLQNADDAKTDKVLIEIDREKQTLSISNNGVSFTAEEGIASLMIAHTSSKKREFIGNKGLGFRSILNWVTEVVITTKTDKVVFSQDIARKEFDKLPAASKQKLIADNKDHLSGDEVPFAILAIPRLYVNEETTPFDTTITLKYLKSEETQIEKQLKLLAPEVLLFLNYTRTIAINDTSGILDKNISKNIDILNNQVSINDATWNLKDSDDVAYKTVKGKEQFYRYKIAWKEDLSDENTKFFTYFTTQERIHLPFLIHATFDLDPTRNHINPSPDNIILLEEIAKTIGVIAESKMKKEKSDWSAFTFLYIEKESENDTLESFYKIIEEYKNKLSIYPCVDGSYCTYDHAVFYGDEFSSWVIRNEMERFFPNLLIPIETIDLDTRNTSEYTEKEWIGIFNNVTAQLKNVTERALLIKLLTRFSFNAVHNSKIKMPLLIDTSEVPIPFKKQAFMMKKERIEKYHIPKEVEISFMSEKLYEALKDVFSEEIESNAKENEDPSRLLKKLISDVVNIGSNDITDVIKHIVLTSTTKISDDTIDDEEKIKLITEMVISLFSIYQVNPDRRNSLSLELPLLNEDYEIKNATNLFLGGGFDFGKKTARIFKDIFSTEDYILGNEHWGLENKSKGYLDSFFIWLGVSRITKTEEETKKFDLYGNDEYTKYVFGKTKWPENNCHKEYKITKITNFDEIIQSPNFTLEILIAWLVSDSQLSTQLNFENSDEFSYSYHSNITPVNYKPSFIYYQIKELYLKDQQTKFISDLDFAKELGYNSIDFKHPIFDDLQINPSEITNVLIQLNISRSFNELNIEEVYGILKDVAKIKPEEKYTRKIYALAFNFFKLKKDFDFDAFPKEYELLASKNNKKEYKSIDKVYYSDNATLPSKIAEDFWVFDFQKRSGESQISKFFGVKTFKEVDIHIDPKSIEESNISSDFQKWFLKIKPYLLAYRLISAGKSTGKIEADQLKKAQIYLVSSLKYKVEKGEYKNLMPGEFLPNTKEKGYYLCVEQNTRLEIAKDTPAICEAFSEILCVLFKVNEHIDNYRIIFKDKNTLKDTNYTLQVKSLVDNYHKAIDLLGISTEEIAFWTKIYEYKGIAFPENVTDTQEMAGYILKDLKFTIPKEYSEFNYDNFDEEHSINLLRIIETQLKVPISHLFDRNSEGILNYHKKNFINAVFDLKEDFNRSIWNYLNGNSSLHKNLISFQRTYSNIINSKFIENVLLQSKFKLDVDYYKFVNEAVKLEFKIEINEGNDCVICIRPEYKKLLKDRNIDEVEIEDPENRSLLYFDGNKDEIVSILDIDKKDDEGVDTNKNEEGETGELIYATTKKIIPSNKSNDSKKRKNWVHSLKEVKKNKSLGKMAESLVYNTLMKSPSVEKVEWVSSFSNTSDKSDEENYDMRYKPVNNKNWKYLEVKSFNGRYFHLTNAEKNKGIEIGKDYEVALVFNKHIHVLENYFIQEIDFENNELFYAMPADYIVSLKLETEK